MSGTVRERDGKWEYRYDAGRDPVTGRRLRPGRSGFTSREAAEAALDAAERAHSEVADRVVSEGGRLTVLAYLTRWLTEVAGTLRPSTWTNYGIYVASHIAPALGTLALGDLTAGHLNRLYAHLLDDGRARGEGGLSPKTVLNIHRMLHRALSPAVADGLLAREVLEGATPPAPGQEPSTWNPNQLRQFLRQVHDDRHQALWLLLMSTDMDRHDLVSLRRDHLDLTAGRLVRRGEERHLDRTVLAALRDHITRATEERNLLGLPTHLVFTHPDGRPLHPHRVTVWFHQRCDDAGLPKIRVQALRHAYSQMATNTGPRESEDADREAASAVASLILHPTDGRERGRNGVHNGSTTDKRPADQKHVSAGQRAFSHSSGGRI